jgi:hypothetical protein
VNVRFEARRYEPLAVAAAAHAALEERRALGKTLLVVD